MITFGLTDSRMKDYYDVVILARTFPFDGSVVVEAIRATFGWRQTAVPAGLPVALTDQFAADDAQLRQ